ncbi:MAG: leucyl/phenylalanyl-tRNA--protein transferase [Nitrospirae bacterium]|nr:MAG: leucyl/phenylalanyl-tRNA--protein transferase [Nitrospirota bacterium]
MPFRRLIQGFAFPDPRGADAAGLVAYGGDLHPHRVLAAYARGIFPWPYDETTPLLWFSPDPRMVLRPADLHVSKSLQKLIAKHTFEIRFDSAFDEVIRRCAAVRRPGQPGTWITGEMIRAYGTLHEMGFAHSAEAWQEGRLVGGLYGVSLGAAFFGESMFTERPNASKAAFVHLVRQLRAWDCHLVDCQVYTEHLARFGAAPWPRARFLDALAHALAAPTRPGPWR